MSGATGRETRPEDKSPPGEEAAERLPTEIDGPILRKYCTLTDDDFGQVAQCRGASNKLGFARCEDTHRQHLLRYLTEVAQSGPRTDALRKAAHQWLLEQRVDTVGEVRSRPRSA